MPMDMASVEGCVLWARRGEARTSFQNRNHTYDVGGRLRVRVKWC